MSGEKKEGKVSKVAKVSLPHGWIVLHSKTYPNRTYYYNKITKCSTWKSPCEVGIHLRTV